MIGANVTIGRDCTIAAGATLASTLIGNHVIIHPGARIGQDGFRLCARHASRHDEDRPDRPCHPSGSCRDRRHTTIDRGTMDDTVIGEGTKIDNLVQIGHNVRIGRHCGIVAQVGIAGSTTIGNGVMIGGNAGLNGHITVGDGAQIAAKSGVASDVGRVSGSAAFRPGRSRTSCARSPR